MQTIKYILIVGILMILSSFIHKDSLINKETMYILINNYRVENSVNILEESSFCNYAKERSIEIATDWSHTQFLQDSSLDGKFYTIVCPECRSNGENIANGQFTNKQLFNEWKNSPKHNENLLDPDWEIICLETTWRNGVAFTALEFGDVDGK